jgi:hypothetical protein
MSFCDRGKSTYMKKTYCYRIFLITYTLIFALSACFRDESKEKYIDKAVSEETINVDDGLRQPLTFQNLQGRWFQMYDKVYGYDIRFYPNFKALVILHLNNQYIVFKGVYTIEDTEKVRINIVESKQAFGSGAINIYSGFSKIKSSHFVFRTRIFDKQKSKILELRPKDIIINGNDSDGYFEPLIRLPQTGQ